MKKIVRLALLAITLYSCISIKNNSVAVTNSFDFEAHRGGRGLMPENTIAAMKNAIDIGVTTLEMDIVISKDNKAVVSHDLFFNDLITTKPDGKFLSKKEAEEYLLYKMTYDSIKKFDVGMKPYPAFPQQKKVATYKPLLSTLLDSTEAYAKRKSKTIHYNIEIKSNENFDGIRHPDYKAFCELMLSVINEKNILDRTVIQSFDVRALQYIHQTRPSIRLSYLVENTTAPLSEQLNKLGFLPQLYSPNFHVLTKQVVSDCHQKSMKVIPWTVNTINDMNNLIAMGVDGIISDYPNLFAQLEINKNH